MYYSLPFLNNKYPIVDKLQDNILDSRVLGSDGSNNYELKVWLNGNSDNNEGKHFHYKIDFILNKMCSSTLIFFHCL